MNQEQLDEIVQRRLDELGYINRYHARLISCVASAASQDPETFKVLLPYHNIYEENTSEIQIAAKILIEAYLGSRGLEDTINAAIAESIAPYYDPPISFIPSTQEDISIGKKTIREYIGKTKDPLRSLVTYWIENGQSVRQQNKNRFKRVVKEKLAKSKKKKHHA